MPLAFCGGRRGRAFLAQGVEYGRRQRKGENDEMVAREGQRDRSVLEERNEYGVEEADGEGDTAEEAERRVEAVVLDDEPFAREGDGDGAEGTYHGDDHRDVGVIGGEWNETEYDGYGVQKAKKRSAVCVPTTRRDEYAAAKCINITNKCIKTGEKCK